MKIRILTLASLAALLAVASLAHAQTAPAPKPTPAAATQPWKQISIPPLHEFKPAQPKRIQLTNGMLIFLQEDHELPFINGQILIRGGSRQEPAGKIGLVRLYGEAWRTSGTKTHSGDQLDDILEAKAAHLESSGGTDSTSLSWNSLKQDFDSVFADAVDLLLHPEFKPDKLQLGKRQIETGISRRNDDAAGIASREANKLIYGADSPYARQAEFATVEAVTLDDLKKWHDSTVVPNNIIIGISGDFDPAVMEAKLRAAFESLPKGTTIQPDKLSFPGPKPGVYFVEKSDVDQSNIYIVGLGTVRNNPDYYALSVMDEIFSGGFSSRVVQKVRTKLGLAYSVGGGLGTAYDHPGRFSVVAGTKSASTVAATQAMMDEIKRLKTDPPTPTELRKAKDDELNSFIFNYDSPSKVMGEQISLAFYGYPADFLEKYRAGIEKVTAEDVSRVANKYIDPSKLAILVVGNESEMGTPLSKLGAVTNIDITIPMPEKPAGK